MSVFSIDMADPVAKAARFVTAAVETVTYSTPQSNVAMWRINLVNWFMTIPFFDIGIAVASIFVTLFLRRPVARAAVFW